jgi:hypothetical protein
MIERHSEIVRDLLGRVSVRWRTLRACHAVVRAALAAAALWAAALLLIRYLQGMPRAVSAVAIVAILLIAAAALRALAPLRRAPSDRRVARFIEERIPALDDRIASAVDLVASERHGHSPDLAEPMLADAASRARAVELEAVVPSRSVRRAASAAVAALVLLAIVAFVGRGPTRQAVDATALALFPHAARLEVTPGNATIRAGAGLTIGARLVGNRAPITARVEIEDGAGRKPSPMTADPAGRFRLSLGAVDASFRYRVVAGPLESATYAINVVHPPHVTRIDLDYTYPPELRLQPRTEADTGDIYAPAGTDVRVHVHTDRAVASARLNFQAGNALSLEPEGPTVLGGALKVIGDGSYRIALLDADGISNRSATEYFIRILSDRPPEVHITRPAADRPVTKLEEVDIEAQADDDYGIARLELAYSVGGGAEKVVPLEVPPRATSVDARHTLLLEDLGVQPGDLVSYYVRARDVTRGSRPNEAKSDIFFLEVRPYEQEFTLAQSQSMAGGGSAGALDELINAQKQVVVATWQLDRRARTAGRAPWEQDVRAVSRTQAEIKARVDQTSASFRETTMRDPRARGGAQPGLPTIGQPMPEEDDMAAASNAMGQAVTSLDGLATATALPPEMDALHHLLRAESAVKKRQISRQQAGAGGAGNSNRNYDISTLFDNELRRTEQTNYETPKSTQSAAQSQELLDKVRELAHRQDELLKRQQELARDRAGMDEDRVKRQLEQLTREQLALRQQAEEIARQMSAEQAARARSTRTPEPERRNAPQSGPGSAGPGDRMREASREMGNAADNLRRQDPAQASTRGSRALEQLRQLERQIQASRPDERRRMLGDMQMEARTLADAERQLASELGRLSEGESAGDALRRLAGEQEALAGRTGRLQDRMKGQVPAAASGRSQQTGPSADPMPEAAQELERQQLRMRQSAEQMRAAAGQAGKPDVPKTPDTARAGSRRAGGGVDPRAEAAAGQEIARALDKVADTLASADTAKDADSRRLLDQLAHAQELRDQLDNLGRRLQQMGEQGGRSSSSTQGGGQKGSSSSDQKGTGEEQSGQGAQSGRRRATGGAGSAEEVSNLRNEYSRQLRETQNLIDQMRRETPGLSRGDTGFTFEGQGDMTLSAPGTEGFKQDFARWEELRRQATQALENVQLSLSKQLEAQEAKDRLASGVDDKAPAEYQKRVDEYFKALANEKP